MHVRSLLPCALVALLAGSCGDAGDLTSSGKLRVESFTCSPAAGPAPLTATCTWSVVHEEGSRVRCAVDFTGDGNPDQGFADCAATRSATEVLTRPGSNKLLFMAFDI